MSDIRHIKYAYIKLFGNGEAPNRNVTCKELGQLIVLAEQSSNEEGRCGCGACKEECV